RTQQGVVAPVHTCRRGDGSGAARDCKGCDWECEENAATDALLLVEHAIRDLEGATLARLEVIDQLGKQLEDFWAPDAQHLGEAILAGARYEEAEEEEAAPAGEAADEPVVVPSPRWAWEPGA